MTSIEISINIHIHIHIWLGYCRYPIGISYLNLIRIPSVSRQDFAKELKEVEALESYAPRMFSESNVKGSKHLYTTIHVKSYEKSSKYKDKLG